MQRTDLEHPPTLISTLGGFSQQGREIRSFQDLLQTIQPLGLTLYPWSSLYEEDEVGEGASYKVLQCTHRTAGDVVAVKLVKLPPPVSESNARIFQARVACVLKDLEVMNHAPIRKHPNILDLLGYGWHVQRDSIPFLVTAYAQGGTLRQFLLGSVWSLTKKRKFAQQVASGLHELHMSGIAHGDVKLDNVLVKLTPLSPSESVKLGQPASISCGIVLDDEKTMAVAQLSDFGNALLLSPNQKGDPDQRYYGTTVYV